MAPRLAADGDALLATWIEPVENLAVATPSIHRVRFARLLHDEWSEPATIAEGDDFFVNWADFPAIVRSGDGSLYAHWLQKSGSGTYAYDIMLARSADAGATWEPLGPLNDDGTETEHGFVSFVPEPSGVRAFWLDGRKMGGGGDMALMTAHVDVRPGPAELLDGRTCECCQTAAAATPSGFIVAYRDRSAGEVRDIHVVRGARGSWSEPSVVHADGWEVPGCPVNGAAMDAAGHSVVTVWPTAAGNRPVVLAAFSEDGGESYGEPIEIDTEGPLGRVAVVLLPGGRAVFAWMGMDGNEAVIRLRSAAPDGRTGPAIDIARSSGSRSSGFPQLALTGRGLYIAWTETGDPSTIRAMKLTEPPLEDAGGDAADPEASAVALRGWDRRPGSLSPDFTGEDLDGRKVTFEEMRGRPWLLNLWATWCAPCREEMPDLIALHEAHREGGFQVVGLSVDEPGEVVSVRSFVAEKGMTYPVLVDPGGRATALFGVSALPASFLFDRKGVLLWKSYGLVKSDDPAFREALARALEP
jgi:peroxiredoxin